MSAHTPPSLLELEAAFCDGYTPDDLQQVLPPISRRAGVELVCVWDHHDAINGHYGHSEVYVRRGDQLHELTGGLWAWLIDGRLGAPYGPGSPDTWTGPLAEIRWSQLITSDGDVNATYPA